MTIRTLLNQTKFEDKYDLKIQTIFSKRVEKFEGKTLDVQLTEQNYELLSHLLVAQILYGSYWAMPYLFELKEVMSKHLGHYLKFVALDNYHLDVCFETELSDNVVTLEYLAFHNAPWWEPLEIRCNRDKEGDMVGLPVYSDPKFTEHTVVGDPNHVRYTTHPSFRDPAKNNFQIELTRIFITHFCR